jgi:hypothetical protein
VKKLTGDFDNGLGAVLIDEHILALFRSKKSREGISGLFNSIGQKRPTSERPPCLLPPAADMPAASPVGGNRPNPAIDH